MNKTLRKLCLAALTSKLEHQDFSKNFNSQRTCVSNFKALRLTEPKILDNEFCSLALMSMRRVGGGEHNNFRRMLRELLMTMNNYLLNNMLV